MRLVLLLRERPALKEHHTLIVFDAESWLPERRLLLDDAGQLLVFAVLCDADSRVYLPLHGLELALPLHEVPVSRLIGLVGYSPWLLVWLPVVIRVEDVGVVDGQSSRLLLRQVTALVLINLDLPLDLLESARIHLRGSHETAHPALEVELFDALRRDVLVLLFDLGLNVSWQLLHVREDFNLPGPVLQ